MSLPGTLTLSTCCFLHLLHAVYHVVNNRTAFYARLCRLLRDDHMPCALGLYADMCTENFGIGLRLHYTCICECDEAHGYPRTPIFHAPDVYVFAHGQPAYPL